MVPHSLFIFLGYILDFLGAIVISFGIFNSFWDLIKHRNNFTARIMLTKSLIFGLSIKLSAALIKAIIIQTWDQIAMAFIIFAITTVIRKSVQGSFIDIPK